MKKRNKIMALLMAGVLACGLLVGCGASGSGNTADTQTKKSQETDTKEKESQAAKGEDTQGADNKGSETKDATVAGGDDASGGAGAQVEPLSLTLTTAFSETEMAGQVISHFIDYLKEKSGGAVTIDVYWGGTLVSNTEELTFVGSAAADMTVVSQSTYTSVLPLMNFPSQVVGSYDAAVDFMDEMIFNNETTAPLIQAQIEAQNVKMLGSVATGSNAFVAKKEATSLADLTSMKLGVGMNQSAFESLGFNGVVTVMPWDYYDSLSRGIADVGYMSSAALVSMSVHEVTPYFLMDGTYVAGNFLTINLDKWNSMSQDQQALFEAAMKDTAAYSISLAKQLDEDSVATIEGAGGKVVTLPDEDTKAVQEALFTTGAADCRSFAKAAGCETEMETVLKAVGEYLGIAVE